MYVFLEIKLEFDHLFTRNKYIRVILYMRIIKKCKSNSLKFFVLD